MAPCIVKGCGRERQARGLCWRHYQAARSRNELPPRTEIAPLPAVILSEAERNYLAGLFDGEGTVCVLQTHDSTKRRPTPKYELRVGVVMTHEATVQRFRDLFGGRLDLDRRRPKIKYKWTASNRIAARVLATLHESLRVKAPHAEIAAKFLATVSPGNRGRNLVDQAIFAERTRLADVLGTLNDSHWHAKRIRRALT